jgi:hypothetical protein
MTNKQRQKDRKIQIKIKKNNTSPTHVGVCKNSALHKGSNKGREVVVWTSG